MLVEAHFDAELAKKQTFLCSGAEADNFCFGGVEYL
jgi:hypothetical protein